VLSHTILLVKKLTTIAAPSERVSLFRRLVFSRTIRMLLDGGVVAVALFLSYEFRFDGRIPSSYWEQLHRILPYAILLHVASNHLLGVYSLVWHFIGQRDAGLIASSVTCSAAIFSLLNVLYSGFFHEIRIPIGVSFLYPILVYVGWIGIRALRRVTFRHEPKASTTTSHGHRRRPVLLVGAGEAGLYLSRELSHSFEFKIIGFLDDSPELQGRSVEGYRVLGSTKELEFLVQKHKVDEIILCMPSAANSAVLKIAARCQQIPVRVSTVPTLLEIVLGTVNVGRLRAVQMEELLGRASVSYEPDEQLVSTYRERRILITGAGGSIGSELARQLRKYHPAELILLDKDENSLHETSLELQEDFPKLIPIVANIRDLERTEMIFRTWKPEVVFHAAAYKHVPLMEHNAREAILNNVVGTENVVHLSEKYRVRIFVLISTDKAINPSSIMGASKRVAEMIVQDCASNGTQTRYGSVRFGNVLGSRASVVPLFQRRIREGKSIAVSHPEVKRYFMTIPEAAQLVIQAGSLCRCGETFLLDMGDPVRIVDLARNLIELSGLTPDQDIKIEFTGLRPGEKLSEELFSTSEDRFRNTKYPKIFVVDVPSRRTHSLMQTLTELETAANSDDLRAIQRILTNLDIGYRMNGQKAEAVLKSSAASA
jgi:FlaA1/EpsC-like NDP-sugar epimerase